MCGFARERTATLGILSPVPLYHPSSGPDTEAVKLRTLSRLMSIGVVVILTLGYPVSPGVTRGTPVTRADGATQIPITEIGGSLQNACWSPTGDRLVITQFKKGYNAGLSVVRLVDAAGGPELVRLSGTDAQSVSMPGSCWSAVHDQVAYSADPVGPDQIFIVPASGGDPERITEEPQVAWEPTFSPDGEWIVFESHMNGRKGEIYKVSIDGTDVVALSTGRNDRQPNWSPAGDQIVFQRHSRDQVDVWVMEADGSNKHNVTKTPNLEETDVSWSPTGDYLVFSSDGAGFRFANLFTIAADGTDRERLTHARRRYDGAPSWSPDGSTIAFESRRGDPDGSPGTTIWTIPAPEGRS